VSEREQIERAAFEEVLRQMPARVVVAEAPSGEIIFLNSRSQQVAEEEARAICTVAVFLRHLTVPFSAHCILMGALMGWKSGR
jgi:hypothetical protein